MVEEKVEFEDYLRVAKRIIIVIGFGWTSVLILYGLSLAV